MNQSEHSRVHTTIFTKFAKMEEVSKRKRGASELDKGTDDEASSRKVDRKPAVGYPAVKRGQRFLPRYTTKYPCIVASKVSAKRARCSVCDSDFLISHGGRDDVEKHVSSRRHKAKAKAIDKSGKMTSFFAPADPSTSDDDTAAIRAEALYTQFLVEHNLPLSDSGHDGELFRFMFPDSKIAQSYGRSSGGTKTTKVTRACGGSESDSEISAELAEGVKNGPSVLGTDGSPE